VVKGSIKKQQRTVRKRYIFEEDSQPRDSKNSANEGDLKEE
jgi:hypothetical protein